jgi:hypothetical protein
VELPAKSASAFMLPRKLGEDKTPAAIAWGKPAFTLP